MDPARALLDLVYPPACRICSRDPSPGRDFCPPCLADLHGPPHRPIPRHLDRVISAYAYEGAVRDLVHRLKFRGERGLGPPLGRWIGEAVRRAGVRPDLLVPVPLHWRRAIGRGYNQAEILARVAARHLGAPMDGRMLRRVRPTRPQTQLEGIPRRRANVQGAFSLRHRKGLGGIVVIVDDVLTTGATAGQCALLLRAAGAGEVMVAVIAG